MYEGITLLFKTELYNYPSELDFFEREFGLSEENNSDEGVASYIRFYEDGSKLIVSHSPFGNVSFSAKLVLGEVVVFNVYQEYVTEVKFEAWGDEKIIRVHCNQQGLDTEYRVYYLPRPRIYVANT